jgi:hypothetical protein
MERVSWIPLPHSANHYCRGYHNQVLDYNATNYKAYLASNKVRAVGKKKNTEGLIDLIFAG